MFNDSFLTSYPVFTKSSILLNKLIDRYDVPSSYVPQDNTKVDVYKNIVQSRVTVMLKRLLLNRFEECNESVIERAKQFIASKSVDEGENGTLKSLLNQIDRKVNERNNEITSLLIPPIDFYIPDEYVSPVTLFMLVDDIEIARQITLVDYSIYNNIDISELCNADVFTKNELRYKAENVMKMSDRVNEILYMVATLIISFPDLQNRVKMMTKMLNVAEKLFAMNNSIH